MKKWIISVTCVVIAVAVTIQMGFLESFGVEKFFSSESSAENTLDEYQYVTSGDVNYRVKAEGNSFYFYENGEWIKRFIKGVNIGAGEPGLFPGDLSISYEDYYHWFTSISEMNANCIRVYTTQRPQFYNALLDFNKQTKNPLYIFQGVWIDEDDIDSLSDAYAQNGKIINNFTQDAKDLVDVIHGNSTLPVRAGYASGVYTADVSPYFAGWILGTEWDPKFVQNTNDSNPAKNAYDGKYLYTLSATPFEAFLCSVGDAVITYQTEHYHDQATLAFTNWVTTDPLTHNNEPNADEDSVTVNMENIKSRSAFLCNQFACYHVYPYYPDFMNYQEEYLQYKEEDGNINTYRAYLKDLKMAHTMPVMIAEFGIPTSRGMGHENVMGYNQGNVDETEQGEMLLDMMNSMYKESYAGGIVFTWQDEWFKRTWNNVNFDVADSRPFWSNVQTNEQSFGILAFDPGENDSICYVDGDISDWATETPVLTNSNRSLYMKSDERYVYLMADLTDYDFDTDTLIIPLDTIANQGNQKMNSTGTTFDLAADFVLSINGKDNSRLLVDSYYDVFYYQYGEQYKMIDLISDIRTKNSGRFHTMQMCYGYQMTIPVTNTVIPFKSFETGKLVYGNADPDSSEYQSLADFCYKDGKLEIKIPWQLLNVMDPTNKKLMDDFYALQSITATEADGFSVGLGVLKSGSTQSSSILLHGSFDWSSWKLPTCHERLKPAYTVLQKGLLELK